MYLFCLQFDLLDMNARNFNKFEIEYNKDFENLNFIWNLREVKFTFHFYKEDKDCFCEMYSLLKLRHFPMNKEKMTNTIMKVLLEIN